MKQSSGDSMKNLSEKKIVLGLSGGVDSTTAALILKQKGYEVIGLFFDITETVSKEYSKAKTAANQLGIELIYKNVHEEFNNIVVSNFVDEYINGRTPNPCILCNPNIKFKVLINTANEMGAKYIATGHYADVQYNDDMNTKLIKIPKNEKKDQSYMLYRLDSSIVDRLVLPLSLIEEKNTVRKMARDEKLSNADNKDSQEICFIEDGENYLDFLSQAGHINKKGNFIDKTGKILGEHNGISHFTVGQRKGLGITFGKPVYVTHIDSLNNTVTLGDNEDLFTNKIVSINNIFTKTGSSDVPNELIGKELFGKIRYASQPSKCFVEKHGEELITTFVEKQRAPSPGQSIVLYLDKFVVGGGIIK